MSKAKKQTRKTGPTAADNDNLLNIPKQCVHSSRSYPMKSRNESYKTRSYRPKLYPYPLTCKLKKYPVYQYKLVFIKPLQLGFEPIGIVSNVF